MQDMGYDLMTTDSLTKLTFAFIPLHKRKRASNKYMER